MSASKRNKNSIALFIITVVVFAVVFGLAMLIPHYIWGTSFTPESQAQASKNEEVNKRTAPVYRLVQNAPSADDQDEDKSSDDESKENKNDSDSSGMSGEEVFHETCHACHESGVAGAPKYTDKDDWSQRLDARGIDGLHKHALQGFNAMPPKGGNPALSDDEVKAAVDFMLHHSGAK